MWEGFWDGEPFDAGVPFSRVAYSDPGRGLLVCFLLRFSSPDTHEFASNFVYDFLVAFGRDACD